MAGHRGVLQRVHADLCAPGFLERGHVPVAREGASPKPFPPFGPALRLTARLSPLSPHKRTLLLAPTHWTRVAAIYYAGGPVFVRCNWFWL